MRETLLLYTSIKEPIDELTDEQAGKLFKALLSYQTDNEIELEGLLKVVFLQIKQQIDYNNDKFDETSKKRSEAGKKGMKNRWNKNNNDNNVITNDNNVNDVITDDNKNNLYDNDNDNDNVNDNDNDNVNDNENENVNTIKKIPNNVQDVVDLYHTLCPSLPKVRVITKKRITAIKSFLKQYDIETIKEAFEKAEASDFMKGQNNRGWKADIDFLTNANSVAKVLEDKYKNKQADTITGTNNNFLDKFNQEWEAVK